MTAQSSQPSIPSPVYAPAPHAMPPIPVALGQYDDDLDLGQLLQVLRRRWVVIGGVALAVSGAIWSWTLTRTPVFQGEFRVLIASVEENDPSQELLRDNPNPITTIDYDTQIEVLKSPALLEPIARALQTQYPAANYNNLASHLTVSRLRDTKVLAVSYRHTDAQLIQDVLEEVSDQYLAYSFEQRQANLQQGIQFVDDQLPELRERVQTLQVQLERFRQQYSILDPETRGSEISGLLATVEEQRQQLQAELAQAQSLYQTLQGQLGTTPEDAIADAALSESTRYQALLDQIQQLEAEIAVESARYQPGSPQLLALEEERDNLRPLLEEESARILGDRFVSSSDPSSAYLSPTALELNRDLIKAANNVQMLQARNRTLARIESDIKDEFDLVPALARQYTDLQRDLAIATESLNRFLTTRETLQIDAAQNSVPWQLLAPPSLPTTPISPNIPRNLTLGLVAGVLVGTAAAFMTEKLDQVFHSPDDLKQAVPFPLLGVVPHFTEIEQQTASLRIFSRFHNNGTSAEAAMSDFGNDGYGEVSSKRAQSLEHLSNAEGDNTVKSSIFLEAFRSVYTNIKFLETEKSIRSLVVSSAVPGEGKTTTALYLARAAAVMGQRVLLVDADLRAPKHHDYLSLPNIRGLSNTIADGLEVQRAIQQSSLDPNLSVLTAGPKPPDPVKLLSSQRMRSLVTDLAESYDLVVYDMPPLLGFADSSVLAAHTDGMLLVVGLGRTERSALNRALDDLRISPVSILGVVANGIKAYTTLGRNHYQYYQYYGDRKSQPRPAATALSRIRNRVKTSATPSVTVGDRSRPSPVAPSLLAQHQPPTSSSQYPDSGQQSSPAHYFGYATPDQAPYSGRGEQTNVNNGSPQGFNPTSSYSNPYPNDNDFYDDDDNLADDDAPAIATLHAPFPLLPALSSRQWLIVGTATLTVTSAIGWISYHRFINPNQPQSTPSSPDTALSTPVSPEETPNPAATVDDSFTEAVRLAQTALEEKETATSAQDWARIRDLWYEAATLMNNVPETDNRHEKAAKRSNSYRKNGDYARQQVLQLQISSPPQPTP